MIISNRFGRTLASAIGLSLTVSPVMAEAKAGDGLQDLVGARAGQAEGTLTSRGWAYVTGNKGTSEAHGYWWNASSKDCVKVTTRDGRYAAIEDAKAGDCNQKSSSGTGTAVAVAAVGAVALTALLLSRKSKDRPGNGGYQPEWQRVEVHGLQTGTMKIFANPSKNARVIRGVGEGTVLRNFGCEDYNSESWCEIATIDGRTNGWARDRYLRPTDNGGGWGGGNGGGWGGGNGPGNGWGGDYRGLVEVYGLQSGTLKITAGPSKDDRVVWRVGAGETLRSLGCQTVRGENWCQVATINGRTQGWARERYLRQR